MAATRVPHVLFVVALLPACGSTSFGGSTSKSATPAPQATPAEPATTAAPASAGTADAAANGKAPSAPAPAANAASNGNPLGGLISTIGQIAGAIPKPSPSPAPAATPATPARQSCSANYYVPATSNPYFAGSPSGSSLTYNISQGGGPNPTDTTAADDPVLIQPTMANCITAGTQLSFTVSGQITYTSSVKPTDANGDDSTIISHQLGATNGKSNITAPINSLLGVFLTAADPTSATAPAALDFSTQAARDYTTLSPLIGQIFFIGNGQTSSGAPHVVTVPAGATRLYFAVMDEYQWNNNVGGLTGSILIDQ